ncbi:MAG TPA: L,D-transpeptidase family protein, partial [Ginsengibacter sp.]|nr:L,D-transpeptidase family protein [Ginsengibacter sp.]
QKLVPSFVKEMDTTHYDFIPFPDKDSLGLIRNVYSRLLKAGFADSSSIAPDSAAFASALKRYQAKMGLEADGKLGKMTIGRLNQTDDRRFRMIALSLDKYRRRATMPQTYIWANIPSFRLDVWVDDTLRLQSRIVVGKPTTPTPTLVSGINNMVTFPIWTIPESIIKTEILPQLRKDPGYLARKGYNLFTNKGEEVDPFSVDWSKYKNGIPWRIIQGSGDDNALGIFKFNFNNPFSVYLHDTNQRYLFGNTNRALSHGCVRVQKWRELADIIANRDSVLSAKTRLAYNMDSIKVWLGEGARKTIYMKNKFPLYIDYFTCDDNNGKLGFYDDIYNEDALLIEKYFTAK